MVSIADRLDESDKGGNVYDRGFWRHPQSGAPIVHLPEGGAFWGGAPSGRYKSHLENTYNLQRWAERQTLIGTFHLVRNGDIDALPEDLEASKRVLDGLVGEAKDIAGANLAAERGTHGHLLSELNDEGATWLTQIEAGEDLGLGASLQATIVDAWRKLVDEYGLEILAVEQTVVSFDTQCAGTLDRIARTTFDLWFQTATGRNVLVPAGTVLVLDVKTGGLRISGRNRQPQYWDGYVLQCYAYATGRPIVIDPDDPKKTEWTEYPDGVVPSLDHALIAHIDIAQALQTGIVDARIVYVDLTVGRAQEEAVQVVREIRKAEGFGKVGLEPDVRVRVLLEVPYPEVVAWLQRRMEAIRLHDEAKADLLRHWPKGVTPPGKGIAPSDIDTIVELLDRIETKYEFAFAETDPRAPQTGHASDMRERATVAPAPEADNQKGKP